MSILEHIAELRDRLVRSCLALTVTTIATFIWLYQPLLTFVTIGELTQRTKLRRRGPGNRGHAR